MSNRSCTAVETLLTFWPARTGSADEALLEIALVDDQRVGDSHAER